MNSKLNENSSGQEDGCQQRHVLSGELTENPANDIQPVWINLTDGNTNHLYVCNRTGTYHIQKVCSDEVEFTTGKLTTEKMEKVQELLLFLRGNH